MAFPDSNYRKGTNVSPNKNRGAFTVPTGDTPKNSLDSSSADVSTYESGTSPDDE